MFVGKARGPTLEYPTLAYYKNPYITIVISFMMQAPVEIKFVRPSIIFKTNCDIFSLFPWTT
jgi:hypothetical protein